jgi:phosphatidylglycerol:prolipoprotein diacylglycerol transferase
MHPILVDLGTFDLPLLGPTHLFLPTYGALFAVAALVAWWWFLRRTRSLGVEPDQAFNLAFYGLLAGIVGAKLTLIAVEWRYYLENPAAVLGTIRSAGVLLGGVAAGIATFVWYARRHRLPTLRLGDAIAAPLALAQAVGRLGCHAAGCCFGHPVSGDPWWAVVFDDPVAAAQTGVPLRVPLFPSQLAQMLNDLVLAGVLTVLWRRRSGPPGSVFWWYLLLYGLTRGILEFFRGDVERGLWLGGRLSTSQALSFLAVAVAGVLLARGYMGAGAREARAS